MNNNPPGNSPDSPDSGRSRGNERTIMVSCSTCGGARGFCNLRVTRIGGEIVLDPHVAGMCVIVFDETAATVLFDAFGEWLG